MSGMKKITSQYGAVQYINPANVEWIERAKADEEGAERSVLRFVSGRELCVMGAPLEVALDLE